MNVDPETVGPVHVLAAPGDRLSLCGVKDYPRVWARHVDGHVHGWGMKVCGPCDLARGIS